MYDDGMVACGDEELVLRRYYFPAGAKSIPYRRISEARWVRLSSLGPWKIHGSSDFVHWFSFDPGRPGKQSALVLRLGRWIRPVVTPDNPERVAAELAAHGVPVISG